jgi:DNA-binding response OmpR family regulator
MQSGLRHRVGILDDNDDSRSLLRFWLETNGFEVLEYSRKADFVQGAIQDKLALGLVDLWLPDGSGLDIPSELKNHAGMNIPILAVTAHAMPTVVIEAKDAGFSGFLTKPLDLEQLSTEIRRHLPNSF